jgi:hypothetical protein
MCGMCDVCGMCGYVCVCVFRETPACMYVEEPFAFDVMLVVYILAD